MPSNTTLALTIIPAITATLSTICSSCMIYNLLHRKEKLQTNYHRLVFFMSFAVIVHSVATGLTTIPSPRDTLGYYSYGNDATCKAEGFAKVFGYSSMLYNFCLGIHFLLTIRYEMSERQLRTSVEPFMHIISLGWPFATAVAGLYLDVYHVQFGKCWIAPYPEGCVHNDEVECISGESAYFYRWIFIGFIFIIIQSSMPVIMFLVILKVWKRERDMIKKYDRTSGHNNRRRRFFTGSRRRHNDEGNMSEEYQQDKKNFRRTKSIAMQGTLYVLTFFITWLFPFMEQLVGQFAGKKPLWAAYGTAIFLPLQGFFSFIIYFRPSVSRIRRKNREKSFLWVLYQAVFHHDLHSCRHRNSARFSGIHQINRASITKFKQAEMSAEIIGELNGDENQEEKYEDEPYIETTGEYFTQDSNVQWIDDIKDSSNVEASIFDL